MEIGFAAAVIAVIVTSLVVASRRARRDRAVDDAEGPGAAARRQAESEACLAKGTAVYVDGRHNAGGPV